MAKTAEPGTVSYGTMRLEDLIPAFADELHRLHKRPPKGTSRIVDYINMHGHVDDPDIADEAHFLLEDLFDALDNCAPKGYYFGAHPGDSADYGFWKTNDL